LSLRANQVCLSGINTVAGKAQATCCDCCKSGEKAAAKRQQCDHMDFADPLCTHSYKKCCNDRKEEMPIGKLLFYITMHFTWFLWRFTSHGFLSNGKPLFARFSFASANLRLKGFSHSFNLSLLSLHNISRIYKHTVLGLKIDYNFKEYINALQRSLSLR